MLFCSLCSERCAGFSDAFLFVFVFFLCLCSIYPLQMGTDSHLVVTGSTPVYHSEHEMDSVDVCRRNQRKIDTSKACQEWSGRRRSECPVVTASDESVFVPRWVGPSFHASRYVVVVRGADAKDELMERYDVSKETLVAAFGQARDEWIKTDFEGWLGANSYYEVGRGGQRFHSSRKCHIFQRASTKQGKVHTHIHIYILSLRALLDASCETAHDRSV